MMATVISHPRGKLVAGLLWQSLPKEEADESDIIARALEMEKTAYVLQSGWFLQGGFCDAPDGMGGIFGATYYSLAALVQIGGARNSYPDSWIAAIEVGKGVFSLIAIRDNRILSEGDLVGPEEEIRQKMQAMIADANAGWQRKFAPTSWSIADADVVTLDVLIGESKFDADTKLKPAKERTHTSKIAAAIFLIIGISAFVVYDFYQKAEKKKIALIEQTRRTAEETARKLAEQTNLLPKKIEPIILPHPTTTAMPLAAMMLGCQRAMHNLPLTIGGWERDGVSCANGQASASYYKAPVSLPVDLILALSPQVVVGIDGQIGALSVPLDTNATPIEEHGPQFQEAVMILNGRFQRTTLMGITEPVALNEIPPPPPPKKDEPPIIQNWRTLAFAVNTRLPPKSMLPLLDMPALRVKRIAVNGRGTALPTYLIEGEVYAEK